MSFNHMMHPRNPYKDHPPDFAELAKKYSTFRSCCKVEHGKLKVDFTNDKAVRELTRSILKNDFDLDVILPEGSLVPRIPQKLNYLLILEDILKLNNLGNDVVGIDVGTGASCVYALIGARRFGWRFVATERDDCSVQTARANVDRNGEVNHVNVVHVPDNVVMKEMVMSYPDTEFTFTLCNPPFFEEEETTKKFTVLENCVSDARVNNVVCDRQPPKSATCARTNELSTEGGEVAFVNKMIDDSIVLQLRVKIYSTMLGKKCSVGVLRKRLTRIGAKSAVHTLYQGNTLRWVLMWTFCEEYHLELEKETEMPCASVVLPPRLPFSCPLHWLRQLFHQLLIRVIPQSDGSVLWCEARRTTWTHTRAKRRGVERGPVEKRRRVECVDAAVQVWLGEGDGRDSLADAGNFAHAHSDNANATTRSVAVQAWGPCTPEQVVLCMRVTVSGGRIQIALLGGQRPALYQLRQYIANQLKALCKDT